ncbi:MAG: hypothetical protein E2600_10425, partial [Chryseobacterium sp.]|nr:hypothetical protein [Chryseobacterium sp.]
MSNFVKKYNNPTYSIPFIRKVIELDSKTYAIGSIEINSKSKAYICCRDTNGSILWEKAFDFNSTSIGFFDALVLKNSSILLLAPSSNQVWLINITKFGEKIWEKKYYDSTYYVPNETYNQSFASIFYINELENGNIILTINECNRYVINNTEYRQKYFLNFYKIDNTNGNIVHAKKTDTLKISPLAIVSYHNSIVVFTTGNDNLFSTILTFDENFNNTRNLKFNISNDPTIIHSSIISVSNIIDNKAFIIKYFGTGTQNVQICILEYDFLNNQILKFYKSNIDMIGRTQWFSRVFQNINYLYFFVSGTYFKLKKADFSVESRELLMESFTSYLIIDSIIYVGFQEKISYSGNSFQLNHYFIKSDQNFINCKTTQGGNFNFYLSSFSKNNENLIATISNDIPNYSVSPPAIINIINSTQTDACPPTYDYNLKLVSHNIDPKDFIVNQSISIPSPVGNIVISNTGTAPAAIPADTTIATAKGVDYKTGGSITQIPVGNASVPIYVSGIPTQVGTFSPEIIINTPFVDNTANHLKTPFNVINGMLEIAGEGVVGTFLKGDSYPNATWVGTFQLKNIGNVACSFNDVKIHSSSDIAGLIFTTSTFSPISPGAKVTMDIFVKGTANQTLSNYLELIAMNIPNFKVQNTGQYKLKVNIVDEYVKAKIHSTELLGEKTYIKGKPINSSGEDYGYIQVINESDHTDLIIPTAPKTIYTENSNNFVFTTANQQIMTIPPKGGIGNIPVRVNIPTNGHMPTIVGDWDNEINLSSLYISSNGHKIKVHVKEDILNVEVLNDLIVNELFTQGLPVDGDRYVGSIQLRNNSSLQSWTIADNTYIHTDTAYGLKFKIKTGSKIEAGKSPFFDVFVESGGIPTQTGNQLSYPIDFNINSVSPNGHRIIFNVKEDVLNVEVMDDLVIGHIFDQVEPLTNNIEVGYLKLENKSKVKDITIGTGTRIHLEEQVNGLVFVTGEQKKIKAGEKDVYVKIIALKDYSAINYGPQSYPVGLPIEGVHNPNNYKIIFNVDQEPIKAKITGASGLTGTFTKGRPNDLEQTYGSITIQNETKTRELEIGSGQVLWVSNGFVFSIARKTDNSNYRIPALGGIDDIPVTVSATNTMQSAAECNNKRIDLPTVHNPGYEIAFCVIDEPFDLQITANNTENPLSFIQGYRYPKNSRVIGSIKIKNHTKTRSYIVGGEIFAKIDGLEFRSSRVKLDADDGNPSSISEKDVNIIVSEIATGTGNFTCPIDLLPDIKPDTFNIPFTVVEDLPNIELTHAEFYFDGLKKGVAIPEALSKRIGSITLVNSSLVADFILYPNTPIHSSPNIDGLVFRTSNTENIPMEVGDSVTIDIELEPSHVTPTELGNYREIINIYSDNSYVRNPAAGQTEVFFIDFDVMGAGTGVSTGSGTSLQSPHFALLAAGSKGTDSNKGNHLRWIFSGNLGEKHLPKGDLETNRFHYNKPNDFVNVYKAPYIEKLSTKFPLDLSTSPSLLDNGQRCWIYKVDGISTDDDMPAKFPTRQRILYVYFRNRELYDTLISSKDPFRDPDGFVTAYGENIIEIESKDELFFKVAVVANKSNTGDIYMEILSTEVNKLVTSKYLSFRKKMTPGELRSTRFFAENGRSVRFRKHGSPVFAFEFEFYSDFIASASHWNAWELMGNYGLTTTTEKEVLNGLLGDIHGKWLRYNDKEYVNRQNYIDKWNFMPTEHNDLRMGIKRTVEKYIELSNKMDNPRAEDYVDFNFTLPDDGYEPEEPTEDNGGTLVSYLDLLNVAAIDYHVARLLGLGTLDLDPEVLAGKEYIYMTEYKTLKDPKDENTTLLNPCQLLSMSLPTSINTERRPLAVEISELYKGIPRKQNEDIPVLYDAEGYTLDGKNRFLSIINKPIPSAEVNPSFFPNDTYWDASLHTLPVYAGLEYRVATRSNNRSVSSGRTANGVQAIPSNPGTAVWKKPELSHDVHYRNVDASGNAAGFDTVPIMFPETFGEPLYIHRQTTSGNYFYATYGINLFSRATTSRLSSSITTDIRPGNSLLPPSDIKTWLIQPEKPLMFTSEFEQEKYDELVRAEVDDRTFVRVNFSYDATQDMVTHPLPLDTGVEDDEYVQNTEEYFPDEYDVFADEIEVYFRKDTPGKISAGLYKVEPDNDRLCAIFRTRPYQLASTGETLPSVLPEGTAFRNFIGSLFVVNDRSYVIKNVSSDIQGLVFTVYREEVSRTILAGGSIAVDFNTLSTPETSGNDLFVVMENMQSQDVWGISNPNAFKIQLEFPEVHREIITTTSEGGSVQKYLEKSRGFWLEADITKFEEDGVHKGIYKVTIPDIGLGIPLEVTEHGFYEKNNGSIRIFRNKDVSGDIFLGSRDVFKVIGTEPFGRYINLYVYDSEFDKHMGRESWKYEPQTGSVMVNYYPSFLLYLYKDERNGLTQDAVLPVGDDVVKYSIFGLRSVDRDNTDVNGNIYRSKFSAPSLMAGQKVTDKQAQDIRQRHTELLAQLRLQA